MRCVLWAILFALIGGFAVAEDKPVDSPRNVLLIIADDLGLDLGRYGHPVIKTPNLDALAADGTLFTSAFATVASCSQSRSVIQTGLFNHANGQFGHQHDVSNQHTHRWVRGVSRILAEAPRPYRTGIIGKLHVQPDEVYRFEWDANKAKNAHEMNGFRDVAQIAARAGDFFSMEDARPFFLLIGYSDPHRAAKGFGNRPGGYAGIENAAYSPESVVVPPFLPDLPEVRAELAEYYGAVARVDQGVGLIVKELKETKRYDSTLIVFLSDNGMAFFGAKTNLYDAGVHLPLIIRSPAQKKFGARCDAMVSWVDVVPTILDWAGVAAPYELHGRSFLAAMNEERPAGWDSVYCSNTFHEITMYYPVRAVRTRTRKLILNIAHPLPFPFASDLYHSPSWQAVLEKNVERVGGRSRQAYEQRPKWELYDLEKDPNEFKNVADDPAYAGELKSLRETLKRFQERTKDPWISKYKYE